MREKLKPRNITGKNIKCINEHIKSKPPRHKGMDKTDYRAGFEKCLLCK